MFLGAAVTLGCGGDEPGPAVAVEARDSSGVSIVTHTREALEQAAPFSLADAPAFRLGALGGPEELQFTSIRDADRLSNGDFVIVDATGVRVVNESGDLVRTVGGRGQGPGEFDQPALVAPLPSSGVAVWDRSTGRLAWFDESGSLEASTPFLRQAVVDLWAFPDGSLLGVSDESPPTSPRPGTHMQRNTAHLLRVQRDGSLDSLGVLSGSEWELRIDERGMRIRPGWYFSRLHVAPAPEGLWTTVGTAWELRRHDLQRGALDRIVRFDVPLERFTDADIDEMHRRAVDAAEPSARPALEARHRELDYPDMLPPIENLVAGADGRLWVGQLEALAHTLPSGMGRVAARWIVLDNQGQDVVGVVTLPPRRRLLYADGDGALTVTADELDIPYMEWWPFTRDPG